MRYEEAFPDMQRAASYCGQCNDLIEVGLKFLGRRSWSVDASMSGELRSRLSLRGMEVVGETDSEGEGLPGPDDRDGGGDKRESMGESNDEEEEEREEREEDDEKDRVYT